MKKVTVVVDANILISALITPGRVRRVFLHEKLYPVAPDRVIEETIRHVDLIARYTGIPEDVLKSTLPRSLTQWVKAVGIERVPPETREKAKKLVEEVDPSDWPFIALAMHLGVPLWTGDKELIRLAVKTEFREFKAVDTHGVELLLEGRPWREVEEYLRQRYG